MSPPSTPAPAQVRPFGIPPDFPALCALLIAIGANAATLAPAADKSTALDDWLRHQTSIRSWTAEVTQTRYLKSLVQPLTATGRVWFAAPNQFRWELGDPPRTIAVRQPDKMLVIYPLLGRVEQYPLDDASAGPWRDALALLEAGFPRGRSELEARFRLLDSSATNDVHFLSLQPRSASARRFMPLIIVGFDPVSHALRSTEIRFADGSSMRNDFVRPRNDPVLPDHAFDPVIDPDWEVIQPNRP